LNSLDRLINEISFHNLNSTTKIKIPTLHLKELLSYLNELNKIIDSLKKMFDASQQTSSVKLTWPLSIISTKEIEDLLKEVSFINKLPDVEEKEKDAEYTPYTFKDFMREYHEAAKEEERARHRIPRMTDTSQLVTNALFNNLLFSAD
jgi:hypothetical protein